MVLNNMIEVGQKLPHNDGEEIKPWDPRITSEAVCSRHLWK